MDPLAVQSDEDEMRLDRWFTLKFPTLGHGQLQRLLRSGQIRLDGRRTKSGIRLRSGQSVRIPPFLQQHAPQNGGEPNDEEKATKLQGKPTRLSLAEQHWLEEMCLFCDESLVVLNKPAGLAVQGGEKVRRSLDDLAREWGRQLYGTQGADLGLRLIHRLDRDTSGLIVLANGRLAAARLSRAFSSRQVTKTYLALVAGQPKQDSGEITAPLAKSRCPDGYERMGIDRLEGQSAFTEFELLDHAGSRASLLKLQPKTGRTHQLRAHCALALKCPVIGDGKYTAPYADTAQQVGLAKSAGGRSLHLHAWRLSLSHPGTGASLKLTAPLPAEFQDSMHFLGLTIPKSEDS